MILYLLVVELIKNVLAFPFLGFDQSAFLVHGIIYFVLLGEGFFDNSVPWYFLPDLVSPSDGFALWDYYSDLLGSLYEIAFQDAWLYYLRNGG